MLVVLSGHGVKYSLDILSEFYAAITRKIFKTNSSFHVKVHHGKSLISGFQEFSASIKKTFILEGRLGTRLSFYEVEILF